MLLEGLNKHGIGLVERLMVNGRRRRNTREYYSLLMIHSMGCRVRVEMIDHQVFALSVI